MENEVKEQKPTKKVDTNSEILKRIEALELENQTLKNKNKYDEKGKDLTIAETINRRPFIPLDELSGYLPKSELFARNKPMGFRKKGETKVTQVLPEYKKIGLGQGKLVKLFKDTELSKTQLAMFSPAQVEVYLVKNN